MCVAFAQKRVNIHVCWYYYYYYCRTAEGPFFLKHLRWQLLAPHSSSSAVLFTLIES